MKGMISCQKSSNFGLLWFMPYSHGYGELTDVDRPWQDNGRRAKVTECLVKYERLCLS